MHRISGRPDNPTFPVSGRILDLMAGYPAGYRILQIAGYPENLKCYHDNLSGIRLLDSPDIRAAGYLAKSVSGASLVIVTNTDKV
jgi:hypothetical protein